MSLIDRVVNLFVKFGQLRDYLTESYPVFSPFVVPGITLACGFAVVFTIVFGGIAMVRIAKAVSKYISSLNDPEPSPVNANPYAPYPDISGLFTKDLPKLKSDGSALFNSTDTTTSRPAPAPTASSTVPVPATYWAPDPCPTEGTWTRQCTVPRQADPKNGGHVYYKTMESEYVPYNQPNGRRARIAHEEKVASEQANASQEQNINPTPFGSNNGAAKNAFQIAAEAATKVSVVDKETGAIPGKTASTFGQSKKPRATSTETSKQMEFGGAKPKSPPTPSSFGNISTYRPVTFGSLKRSNRQASVVEIPEVD
ncbi:hypothetical protein F4806DRAFT_503240 [Annulohypoxylon nitens]|nr:hypothetical protein F4806DRAFT_503240 [Annulohypoxylon nitens]